MAAEILLQLWRCTLAVSCSIALILVLRVPLRRAFGARAAYWVWILVPFSLLAEWLPRPHASVYSVASAEEWRTIVPVLAESGPAAPSWLSAVLAAWVLGLITLLFATAMRQRRFLRSLGTLVRGVDGNLRSPVLTSPLVVGALRPQLIVPSDFERRHPQQLRRLMLAHEQRHLERGDTRIAALAVLLVCIFWFNPLVYYAVRLLRMDQEMACDAATLARCRVERKFYAEALIDTQLAEQFGVVLPIGCHWRSAHPLKARISMLKNPLPGRARMMAGIVTVGLFGTGTAMALWAAQPAPDSDGVVVLSLNWLVEEPKVNGIGRVTRLSRDNKLVPLGTELVSGFGQSRYNVACTPSALAAAADGAAQWLLHCKFLRDGKVLALPAMTTSEGKMPSIDMTDPETKARLYLVVNASNSPERIRLARQNADRESSMPQSAPILKQLAPASP